MKIVLYGKNFCAGIIAIEDATCNINAGKFVVILLMGTQINYFMLLK